MRFRDKGTNRNVVRLLIRHNCRHEGGVGDAVAHAHAGQRGGVDVEGGVARHCRGLEEGAVSARRGKCRGAAAAVLLGVVLREGRVAPSTKGTLSTLDRNLYMPNVGLQEITALHCKLLITSSKT